MKYEVWWGGKKEFAEPVELAGKDFAQRTRVRYRTDDGMQEDTVRAEWIHKIKPDVPVGDPVYAWNGDVRPEKPIMGYSAGDGSVDVRDALLDKPEFLQFDHIEAIAFEPKIDWSKVAEDVKRLAQLESGQIGEVASTLKVGDILTYDDHIVRIFDRPGGV